MPELTAQVARAVAARGPYPLAMRVRDELGESCLRLLDGRWILTWFNQGDYRIEGLVTDRPTANLRTARRRTLLWGTSWGNEDDTHVAQLYGGYVIPGSTLNGLHLSVSQWNTQAGWPYRVMQFRVRGLAL
ncbi:DUF4185 domain-containing protein [Streptomyces sp. DH41]|uniref:DUF4185 domain-containing protein n=1 Tax=Streptomyces sp. DH41 TaxID=3040125 RepID=UPI002441FF0C|nr:DUF4185 domain-containing protein [Streptomyces sp. DH41]MDG9728745.1 DUF4185 domain-containing protein [Streptomyces sp. DH41]